MKRDKWDNLVRRNVALGLLIMMLSNILLADIIPDRSKNQNTSVDRSQNGVNIINISTPNQRGISINDFSEFRTKDPTVFNNFGSGVGRSYLAGLMASNPNLTKEQAARLILNRVGGTNRVEIENWLEVMSKNKTDMVFSSTNGFYLNNTGFINFDKVIFTTSRVDIDGNGDMLPFNIRGGDIKIGREGINADGLRYLAFLSRQINIDGQVYAKDTDLDVIAGDFDYNPNTREYTRQGGSTNELLISSSAYGSMYGSQIKIVAVNGNIGVGGDAISERVIRINADGTIVTNRVQAKEGIEIKGKEFTQEGSTYTEGNLTVEADKTTLKGSGTQAGNILITGDLDNEVNIYSKNNIEVGRGLINRSGQIVAENNIRVNNKVVNRDLIYGKNSILIGKELENTGDIQSKGNVTVGSNTNNTGKVLSEGSLKVDGKLESTGTIYGKNKVEIKDEFKNDGDLQSEGDIIVGSDTTNTGRIISDKNIDIQGNLDTSNTVYAKENITVSENLLNKQDIQAEGNISVGKDVDNKGRLLSDKELNIKGNTSNEGTLYGKENIIIEKDLTNKGNIQTGGNLKANNTLNEGKIVSEGNVELGKLDNRGELTLNKQLVTKELTNQGTGKINTGEGIQTTGNVVNHGEVNTNGSFVITGGLTNHHIVNVGGLLQTTDILNHGNLKAVDKIFTLGINFTNYGEILTTILDINNTSILNTNKITVIDNARLHGNVVTNNSYISGTNIEIITGNLTNTGTIAGDKLIKANNTVINNTGYIGSNSKINLSGSNLTNSGTIESAEIELYNLLGYNNLNLIRGGAVSLTTTGNLNLTGTLHGENWLQIHGYDIWNNGATTGIGYIEIKGHDITNNQELASGTVVLEGTGNVINNKIIEGENGRITGHNITNNDLIAFSGQLGLKATDKIINNLKNVIYGGELLDIEFNTLENLSGELLSQKVMNLRGNYLLNKVVRDSDNKPVEARIESTEDINIDVTKIDNIGEVEGLSDYEIYYETWDGRILTQSEVDNIWKIDRDHKSNGSGLGSKVEESMWRASTDPYAYWFVDYFKKELQAMFPLANGVYTKGQLETYFNQYTTGDGGYIRTSSGEFPVVSLKGKIKSNAVTTHANISSGSNMIINGSELTNRDSKISAGNTGELNVGTIRNQTTLGDLVQLKDGIEYYKQEHYGSQPYHLKYWRGIANGDLSYVAGQASVIEARNLIINTGNLEITNGVEEAKQMIYNSTTSGGSVSGRDVNKGVNNGTGIINVEKNISPILDIITSGILPIDPLGANSSLFTMTNKPTGNTVTEGEATSKYLLETRSKYINLNEFYGSDYYLSRIGYDENSDWNKARRLGDAYYEYLLVTRAISDKLGTRFINGLSDKELMKAMLDNSVELQKDLQLSVGVALTPDQVKALKSDVIWYEYEVVNGEKVLVPKVYLSQTTLATIDPDQRNKIGGLELTVINADDLRNNGQVLGNGGVTYVNAGRVYNVTSTNELAEIKGNDVTVIATAGNIENIGGRIKGVDSVTLSAENGDIINSSNKVTARDYTNSRNSVEYDSILSVGSIESDGVTYIEGRNYKSEAGIVIGETTVIDAKENIEIGSLTLNASDRSGINSGNYRNYDSVQKVGSEVTGTENVILEAGKDIIVRGSSIGSDGMVQMTAENINILNEKESITRDKKSTDKGFMSSHSVEEKSHQEYASGSTIIGNNIILDASNDINIKASTVAALKNEEGTGGNISAVAGNNINILVDTLDNSYYRKEKSSGFSSSFSSGGGGLSVGVSYNKSSLEQNSNGTTVATSTIISEGSTVLDAGNRIRTEAIQADIGENLVIRGVNGVELLDAQEVYNETIKQKSSSIGVNVSVGFTPAQLASTVSDVSKNMKDYGFGNASQTANTLGNGFQDLRNVTQLGGNLYDGIQAGSRYLNGHMNEGVVGNAKQGALSNLVSANVSASYSQSKYESNTSGTTSVAGNINVGKNLVIQSDGDVKLINQKVNVGENLIVDAKNFEVRAGENTYKNDTKSSSMGMNAGYDIINKNLTGGVNASGGNSNTSSKYYDNSVINVGNIFQLTTKEDAIFAGVNVIADKINFDIGRDLSIISLQDESKSSGKNWGAGIDVSGKISGTGTQTGSPIPTGNGSYSQNNANSKWVSNQTTILAENGGNIKVDGTLTNVGSIVGSLSEDNKLSVEAGKVVVENLKDHNRGENAGVNVSGVGSKTPIGQTGLQYGSHDKEQNTNATFVNTEVTEAGVKLDLDSLGINTDINKAQVITKDEKVDQIDTVLHTDMANKEVRDGFMEDLLKTGSLVPEIVQGIQEGIKNEGETVLGQISNNMSERSDDIKAFVEGRDKKLQDQLDKYKNEDGKIILNSETSNLIEDHLRKTLDEFGKGDYDIVYFEGDPNQIMSIDDKNGIVYVNVNGYGAGNAEEMRKSTQHEGGHGTYGNRETDDDATGRLGQLNREKTDSNLIIDKSMDERIKEGTETYNEAVQNGDVRDCLYVSGSCISNSDYAKKTNVWKEGKGSDAAISIILDFVPVVGDVKGVIEAVRGKDILTNEELSTLERLLNAIFLGEVKGILKGSKATIKSIKMLKKSGESVVEVAGVGKIVVKNSDIVKTTVKNSDEAASAAKNALKISTGKNFKEHFIKHKHLLEKVTGNKYTSYKEPQKFIGDIEKLIENGTVKYTGKGTLNKGSDVMNIYRGKGVTIVTKTDGEWVTILETGKGMDLNIKFK